MSAIRVVVCLVFLLATGLAQEPVRLGTWNLQALGSSGSTQWNRAVSILQRIDADVVAVQEIDDANEVSDFPAFASQAGYAHTAVSTTSGTLSGALYNGVMSIHPIVFSASHSAAALSGDGNANDITRDIFEAHVQIPNSPHVLGVFSLHLKAGTGGTNDFRRAIETIRVKQAVDAFVLANPGAPWVIAGDFNEDLGDGPFGNTWSSLPGGLPQTYELGNDISFPVTYDPFVLFQGMGAVIADATQEDSTTIDATRESSGRRLDYVLYASGVALVGDEVYNSNRDNGFDDAPIGNWLPKSGGALPSSYSNDASDHHCVFGDFTVPCSAAGVLYPGTGEDFTMGTGVNGTITSGAGSEVKQASAGDTLFVNYASPNGTFDFEIPLLVAQTFTGNQTPVGTLPGMWIGVQSGFIIYSGIDPSGTGFNQGILPVTGNTHGFMVPAGLGGTNVMMQAYAVSSNAANGFFATSDGYVLEIQ